MHSKKKLFDSTRGKDHELHLSFTSSICDACMKYDEESTKHIYKLFEKDNKEKQCFMPEIGIPSMLQQEKYCTKIYNYVADKKEMECLLTTCYDKLQEDDYQLEQEALYKQKGYLHYIRKAVPGVQRGTKSKLNNMLLHICKGCYQDSLPP